MNPYELEQLEKSAVATQKAGITKNLIILTMFLIGLAVYVWILLQTVQIISKTALKYLEAET